MRRGACALVAVAALVALIALEPVRPAQAEAPVDQITGNGVTQSSVTASWSDGLLGPDNKTVVKPRDPSSGLSFMYPDFQNLKVTVGQTENLVHQAIKVTWTGGKPTTGNFGSADFLQMMECYGDASTGPDPENCEFGSLGLLGARDPAIGNRGGNICATHIPSTDNPPGTADGSLAQIGCDPAEPGGGHLIPNTGEFAYHVPFVPVDTIDKIYDAGSFPFNRFNTNEVQQAPTRPDGSGEVFFQAFTKTEAPGLGCGEVLGGSQARGCWLVIVPRGEYEPNGAKLEGNPENSFGRINESPLGASSWAQRIQIHLGYAPLQTSCPIGSANERETIGTELVSHAIFSWQLALNAEAKCQTLYGYSATPEAASTSQIASAGGKGLAFTTVPIGDEAVRDGTPAPELPPLVYAPVAVSAITLGFNINLAKGFISKPVKLTPRLLAKALTQSYRQDLTDVTSASAGPNWALHNPLDISRDPEFIKLNPEVGQKTNGEPAAPLLTADRSGINQQVWAWIQADSTARAWLGGAPDEYGMVVNPNYQALKLGKAPPMDSFPRADPTCFNTKPNDGEPDPGRCSIDLLPYVENYNDGASRVRGANDPEGVDWDRGALSPTGGQGWWLAPGTQIAGHTMMWAVSDSANLANYGLVPADLCKADGTGCVSASSASLTTALNHAKADKVGLLHVDPAAPGAGGYPLVSITYAAVRATQDPAALVDFAALIAFAITKGQVPGVDPGQLPHGYLPLPDNLKLRAAAAVLVLLALANPSLLSPSPTPTHSNSSSTGGNGTAGSGSNGSSAPNTGAAPPTAGAGASTLPYTISQASQVPAAKTTGAPDLGGVRWVLLAVVLAGLGGSIGGPLLRFALSRRSAQ
jgi:hypothetical protein